ncbi:MAG TPA: cory-CC-star protein [Egibacteraceae bacterium]|nr:cory-CC-star protein [Egibacteraceae bacterium]
MIEGLRSVAARARHGLRRAVALHSELFVVPWRAGLQREANRQQDLLMTLMFLEALGVENPAAYYTMELYPELLASFHDWHRRQGMPRSPEPGMCC